MIVILNNNNNIITFYLPFLNIEKFKIMFIMFSFVRKSDELLLRDETTMENRSGVCLSNEHHRQLFCTVPNRL